MTMIDLSGGAGAERFAQLAVDLHDSGGTDETVQAVVEFALQALNCSHASVALIVGGGKLEIPRPLIRWWPRSTRYRLAAGTAR